MVNVLTHARDCVRRGWPVFPVSHAKAPLTQHGFHDASRDKATIIDWWKQWPDALLAIPTGSESGLFILDIDPEGADWYAEHSTELTAGFIVKTRRGHHLYYRLPEGVEIGRRIGCPVPGVDVLAGNGYAVFWPACGHEFVGDPDDIGPPPQWLLDEILASGAVANSANPANQNGKLAGLAGLATPPRLIQQGERNDWMASFAGRLRSQGLGGEALAQALLATNAERLDPPLPEREVRTIAASYDRYAAPDHTAPGAEEPEPLRRPVPLAGAYPMAALGDILSPAAQRIHDVVQAPDAICGQAVLAAASLACQAHADVLIDGRREPLSLWCLSVAASGERKSAADDIALEPHRNYERLAADEYSGQLTRHEAEMAAHDAAKSQAKKQKEMSAVERELLSLGAAPDAPLQPWLLVTTPTVEGLHKLYHNGQPALGLFHDDGGEFIGGHSMNADNRMKSAAGLSKLWDRGEFDRVRGGDGAMKYYGRRLALHLMVQPVVAETILSDPMLCGQGFLARCLLAWPITRIGDREYSETELAADPALTTYRRVISSILDQAPDLRPGTRQELEPRSLSLSPQAKRRWITLHDDIERAMRDGADYESIRPWASKAPAQILRVSGVLTLVSDLQAGVIAEEAIDQAAALVLYALDEAVRLVGYAQVPTEIQHAQALVDWCQRTNQKLLHSSAALQFGPNSIRSKPAFDAAMRELERAGWAVPLDGGAEIDGKLRRRVWEVQL